MYRSLSILAILIMLIGAETARALEMAGVSIHGFASTGYLKSDHNNFLLSSEDGSFEFNEVGINFKTTITENMNVGLQLYSFDLGDLGNNEIKLDWAFLDYEWKEWLGVRAGKVKAPYGLYNESQDYDMLRTAILLPNSVYNKYQRETIISIQGMTLYGKIPLSAAGKLQYDICLGTSEITNDGGLAKSLTTRGIEFESGTMEYLAGSRLTWFTPLKGLKLAVNYFLFGLDYMGTLYYDISLGAGLILKKPIDVGFTMDNPYIYIFSIEYDFGKLTMAAEYYYMDSDTWIDFDYSEIGIPFRAPFKMSLHTSGYYGLVSYRINSWMELGTYYSIYYQVQDQHYDDVMHGMKDLAISTRFDINESWLIKAEVHFFGGVGQLTDVDNPDMSYEPKWTLFAIKTTFNF